MIHSYFVEGHDAYLANPNTESPYSEGSEPHRSWIAGYNDAWFADPDTQDLLKG